MNVPSDWNNFYSTCPDCGDKTHASERYACSCEDDGSEDTLIGETYRVTKSGKITRRMAYKTPEGEFYSRVEYTLEKRYLTPRQLMLLEKYRK